MPIRHVPHRDLLHTTGTADQLPQILVRWDAHRSVTHVTSDCGDDLELISVADLRFDDSCPSCSESRIPVDATRVMEAIMGSRTQLRSAEELLEELRAAEEGLRDVLGGGPGAGAVEALGGLHSRLTTRCCHLLETIEEGPVVGPVRTFLATRLDILTTRVVRHLESDQTRRVLRHLAEQHGSSAAPGTSALVEAEAAPGGLDEAVLVAYGTALGQDRHLVQGPAAVVGWALRDGFGAARVALDVTGVSVPVLETVAGLWDPHGSSALSGWEGLLDAARLLSGQPGE